MKRETRRFETRFGERILEVASFINEEGQEISYITHDSIMDIVRDKKLAYKFVAKVLEPSHSVVECEMTDPSDNWTATGVGESFYKELDGQNKANPSSIAYKRAFDNVALILLGLPDKYLGSYDRNEAGIVSPNTPDTTSVDTEVKKPSLEELTNNTSVTPEPTAASETSQEPNTEKVNDSATDVNSGFKATEENFPTEKTDDNNANDDEFLNTVLNFGPASGMSVREIADNPADDRVIKLKTLFGMIDKIPDEKQRALLTKIKDYLAA